jgi:hypothetical protein
VPVFQRLYVVRTNDINSASQKIVHQVAANEAARPAYNYFWTMQIHLLFRVFRCHDYFLEGSVAALSIEAPTAI